jgi:Tol biopolymer transport system component
VQPGEETVCVGLGGQTCGDRGRDEAADDALQHRRGVFEPVGDGVAHQITRTPEGQGGSEAPRWGRDRLVYFDSDRAGLGESSFRPLTSNPYVAVGGVDTAPDVSPDGRTVAFIRVKDPTFGSAKSAVFTVRMDGTHLRQLTPYDLDAFEPRWSPDGRWLAFSSHGDSFSSTVSTDIYLIDKDGRRMRQVTHEPPGSHSFGPAWSPEGDRIVYTHVGPDVLATELVVRRLDRLGTTVVYTGSSGVDQIPDWR